mgnify:CR=1 FL=1
MKNSALILIDFQNDYFEEFDQAKFVLKNTLKASKNAALLLNKFREKNMKIIHVQHAALENSIPFFHMNTKGFDIHESVTPIKNEEVIVKNHVNSFLNTRLHDVLQASNIEDVIICGAMSHMCVNSAARASSELNYNTTVVHDACATLDLEFDGVTVDASMVHASSMAALAFDLPKVNLRMKC